MGTKEKWRKPMSINALKEISALPALEREELKQIWKDMFGTSPGKNSKDFMIRKIAWRMYVYWIQESFTSTRCLLIS